MPKSIYNNIPLGEVLHEWDVEEFIQYARSRAWYIFMITVGLAMVIYGLATSNFLFSLIIILVAIILFLHSHQEPLRVPFQITELGIVVGDRFYSYDELDGFYVIYIPPDVKMLFLETKSVLRPRLRIPLGDQDPLAIRETLLAFLAEDTERVEEPFSETMARHWRLL